MKNSKMIMIFALLGMVLTACSGNNNNETMTNDSTTRPDTMVKPADSTSSYRNDRSTDSVSVGSTVPSKP